MDNSSNCMHNHTLRIICVPLFDSVLHFANCLLFLACAQGVIALMVSLLYGDLQDLNYLCLCN